MGLFWCEISAASFVVLYVNTTLYPFIFTSRHMCCLQKNT